MTDTQTALFEEVAGLLNASAGDVFSIALTLEIQLVADASRLDAPEAPIVATVGVVGDVNLLLRIRLPVPFARRLSREFLKLDPSMNLAEDMVNDVTGEIANMVLGAVKSRLSDQGHSCHLTFPAVQRTHELPALGTPGDLTRQFSLLCGQDLVLMDLVMKQQA